MDLLEKHITRFQEEIDDMRSKNYKGFHLRKRIEVIQLLRELKSIRENSNPEKALDNILSGEEAGIKILIDGKLPPESLVIENKDNGGKMKFSLVEVNDENYQEDSVGEFPDTQEVDG